MHWLRHLWLRGGRLAKQSPGAQPPPAACSLSFFDISWLAVRGAPIEPIVAAMDLSDLQPATWVQGYCAVWGDYWDFGAVPQAPRSRVFISPLIEGWRGGVGGSLCPTEQAGNGPVESLCEALRREFGEACAYITQGLLGVYAWVLARDGRVHRSVLSADGLTKEKDDPTPAEVRDRAEQGVRGFFPSERAVKAVAAESSLSCDALESPIPVRGEGFLAKTAWGREYGVPTRPLMAER